MQFGVFVCACACGCVCVSWCTAVESSADLRFVSLCVTCSSVCVCVRALARARVSAYARVMLHDCGEQRCSEIRLSLCDMQFRGCMCVFVCVYVCVSWYTADESSAALRLAFLCVTCRYVCVCARARACMCVCVCVMVHSCGEQR